MAKARQIRLDVRHSSRPDQGRLNYEQEFTEACIDASRIPIPPGIEPIAWGIAPILWRLLYRLRRLSWCERSPVRSFGDYANKAGAIRPSCAAASRSK